MAASQAIVTIAPRKTVTFSEVFSVIESDNVALLETYLTECDVTLASDENFNVLHAVASFGSFAALRVLYKHVSHDLLSMFARSIPDAEGEDNNSQEHERLIIPSVVVSERTELPVGVRDKMQITLESLELSSVKIPMNELIDEKSELATCYSHLDQKGQAYQNLQRVIWTMNEIRKLNLRAYTHPVQDQGFTSAEFEKLRQARRQAQAEYALEAKSSHEIYPEIMQKFAIKYRIANCEERTRMGKLLWKVKDESVYRSMRCYQFDNSDHVFLVLGQDPNCDPCDFRTWGKNAVFCDILNGTFGLAEEIPSLLCGSHYYWSKASNKLVVVHTNFNPNFHCVVPCHETQPEVAITPKRMLAANAAVVSVKKNKGVLFSRKPKLVSQLLFFPSKKKTNNSRAVSAAAVADEKSSLTVLASLCLVGSHVHDASKAESISPVAMDLTLQRVGLKLSD